jgi:uncharacterized protein (UPF0332 family)
LTEENKRDNQTDEWSRAQQALRAAEALYHMGLLADAVSRAYYAAFHALKAVLYTRGVEPQSHAGAIHLFNVELVKPGLMSSRLNRILGNLQRTREMADYDPSIVFNEADIAADIEDAKTFIREAELFLFGKS